MKQNKKYTIKHALVIGRFQIQNNQSFLSLLYFTNLLSNSKYEKEVIQTY